MLRLVALLGLMTACVETYDASAPQTANLLVVEGTLTDLPEIQTVRLSRTRVINGRSGTLPVEGARVEVRVNDAPTTVVFRESKTEKGVYEGPDGFRGQTGSRYQLRLTLPEGARYESGVETMQAVSKIEKVYDRFDPQAIANVEKTRFTPANLIYVDTQDPPGQRNFYQWTWTLWEQQQWCAFCQGGLYYLSNDALSGVCQPSRQLLASNLFDYNCLYACWEILFSNEVNIFSDQYTNVRPITGRLAAKIPFYQKLPALVEIQQRSLTPEAYRYFKLLADQTQNTGGLADTPPAPLVGNVRNLADDRENVVGYFTASGTSAVRYWLNRENTTGNWIGLFEALNGRTPNPEPPSGPPPRPPSAVCVPGPNRTPVKPEGWQK